MSDLISRQAAKLAIIEKGQASKRYKIGEFWELNRNEIWDALDGVPSAHPLDPCETCLHKGKGWDEDPCDGCTGAESKYEPDNGWIPVGERLPEEGECVLVTVHPDYIAPGILAVEKLNYYNGEWVSYDGERLEKFPDPIIAWIPLPDPYKRG